MGWLQYLAIAVCLVAVVLAEDEVVRSGNICKYNRKTKECTACDTTTNSTTCTLQLKKGPRECLQTKTLTKRCPGTSRKAWRKSKNKGVGCKYTKGEWSECNTDSNEITRTLTLKKGPSTCEQTKTVTKRCKAAGRQGAAKTACNFGPWSEFGDCQNGVKTKTREVNSGGPRCQRRAAKTKPCT